MSPRLVSLCIELGISSQLLVARGLCECEEACRLDIAETGADELLAMDAVDFIDALMQATDGAAGHLELAGERAAWPLMRAQAGSES